MTTVFPRYPIYIVSKGRYDVRLTADSLERMQVPYHIVVEEFEYEKYKAAVDPKYCTVLVLDPQYQKDYETCDDIPFGQKSVGPGAARNFAWDHSISIGATSHWVMDDNIAGFYRYYKGKRMMCYNGAIFAAAEDFVDRYENVLMSGLQYRFFAVPSKDRPAYVKNTRIYSCNLIRNDCPFRWRGRYNEDTDLSLQILKAGYCTIQFNAFLQAKTATQVIKGGNTEAFYAAEGTSPKSYMLKELHPDVTELVYRYGRHHHYVNYLPFKDIQLIRKKDIVIPTGINEYGMKIKKVSRKKAEQETGESDD